MLEMLAISLMTPGILCSATMSHTLRAVKLHRDAPGVAEGASEADPYLLQVRAGDCWW